MAVQRIYTIYDSKVAAFLRPFFCRSDAEAIRAFTDTVTDPGSLLNKHPEDFSLFVVGDFDEETGRVVSGKVVSLTTGVVCMAFKKEV